MKRARNYRHDMSVHSACPTRSLPPGDADAWHFCGDTGMRQGSRHSETPRGIVLESIIREPDGCVAIKNFLYR